MTDRPTIEPGASMGPGGRGTSRLPATSLVVVGLLALAVAVITLVVVLVGRGGSGHGTAPAATGPVPAAPSTDPSTPVTSTSATPTISGVDVPPPGPGIDVLPVSAEADSTLESQRGCDGQVSTYSAANAVDGDMQTAWAPSEDDGTGRHVIVDLGRPVQLTEVGIVPGYAKVGPLRWNGCRPVARFDLNRQIASVRYRFDDGSTVDQAFSAQPTLQTMPVATTTRHVDVQITATRRPPGEHVDDDTLISEIGFRGR